MPAPKANRCPFCGSRRLGIADFSGPRGDGVQIDCVRCGSSGPIVTYDWRQRDPKRREKLKRAAEREAIERWNKAEARG